MASSSTPYSETCSPRRTAASRSAALWRAEPVKCCSRLPSCAGLAILRSTPTPECVRALAPALPAELTLSISGSLRRLFASVVGRVVTAIRSRSLTLSAARRADPASCTCVSAPAEAVRPAHQRLADLDRPGQQHARRRAFARAVLERRQHARLELGAEAAHGAQALVLCRLAQLLERVDAEL